MKLYKDGITRNTNNPNIISDLKKAGYEPVEKPAQGQSKAEKEAAKKAEEEAAAKKEGE